MSIEPLSGNDFAGNKNDFAVWNRASPPLVLDFGGDPVNTFRALGSATAPSLATTEQTVRGGGTESAFTAELDLALLNPGPTVQSFIIAQYRRLGTPSAIATDLELDSGEIRVANGMRVADDTPLGSIPGAVLCFDCSVKSTEGIAAQLTAWLESGSQIVALPADATCTVTCREHGAGADVLTFSVNDDGDGPSAGSGLTVFEIELNAEEESVSIFTDDRMYIFVVTIVASGVTYSRTFTLPVIGGE